MACFDNDLVVNSNCSTEGDTSMNALQKVDEVSRYQRLCEFFGVDFVCLLKYFLKKLGKTLEITINYDLVRLNVVKLACYL